MDLLGEIQQKGWRNIQKPQKKTLEKLEGVLVNGQNYWEWEQGEAEKFASAGDDMATIKKKIKKKRDYYGKKDEKKAEAKERKKPDFVKKGKKDWTAINQQATLQLEQRRASIRDDTKERDNIFLGEGNFVTAYYDPRLLLCSIHYPNMNTRIRGMTYMPPNVGGENMEPDEYLPYIEKSVDASDYVDEPTTTGSRVPYHGETTWHMRQTKRTFFGGLGGTMIDGERFTGIRNPHSGDIAGAPTIESDRINRLSDDDRNIVHLNPILDMSAGSVNRIYPLPPPIRDDPSTWGFDERGLDDEGQYGYGLEILLRQYTSDFSKDFSEETRKYFSYVADPRNEGRTQTDYEMGEVPFRSADTNTYITKKFKIAFNTHNVIKPELGQVGLSDEQFSELFRRWERKKDEFYNLIPTKKHIEGVRWLDLEELKDRVDNRSLTDEVWFPIGDRMPEEIQADPDWSWTIGSKGGYLYGSDPSPKQQLGGGGLLKLNENQTKGIRQLPPILVHIHTDTGCVFIKYGRKLNYLGALKYTFAYGSPVFNQPEILTQSDFKLDWTHLGTDVFYNEFLMLRGHRYVEIGGNQYGVSSGINMTIDHLNYRTQLGDTAYHERLIDLHRTNYHSLGMTQEDVVNKIINRYFRTLKPLFMMNNPSAETTATAGGGKVYIYNLLHRPTLASVREDLEELRGKNKDWLKLQGLEVDLGDDVRIAREMERTQEQQDTSLEFEEDWLEWEREWKEKDPTRLLWLRHLGHGFYSNNLLVNDDVSNIYYMDEDADIEAPLVILGRGRPSQLGLLTQYKMEYEPHTGEKDQWGRLTKEASEEKYGAQKKVAFKLPLYNRERESKHGRRWVDKSYVNYGDEHTLEEWQRIAPARSMTEVENRMGGTGFRYEAYQFKDVWKKGYERMVPDEDRGGGWYKFKNLDPYTGEDIREGIGSDYGQSVRYGEDREEPFGMYRDISNPEPPNIEFIKENEDEFPVIYPDEFVRKRKFEAGYITNTQDRDHVGIVENMMETPFFDTGDEKTKDYFKSGKIDPMGRMRGWWLKGHIVGGNINPETGKADRHSEWSYGGINYGGTLRGILFKDKEQKEFAVKPAKPMREQMEEVAEEVGADIDDLYLPPENPEDDPEDIAGRTLGGRKVSEYSWDRTRDPKRHDASYGGTTKRVSIHDKHSHMSIDQLDDVVRPYKVKTGEGGSPFWKYVLREDGTPLQENMRHYLINYKREFLVNGKVVLPQGDFDTGPIGKEMLNAPEGYSAEATEMLTQLFKHIKLGNMSLRIDGEDFPSASSNEINIDVPQYPEPEPQPQPQADGDSDMDGWGLDAWD